MTIILIFLHADRDLMVLFYLISLGGLSHNYKVDIKKFVLDFMIIADNLLNVAIKFIHLESLDLEYVFYRILLYSYQNY